jgi:hypothetical protein
VPARVFVILAAGAVVLAAAVTAFYTLQPDLAVEQAASDAPAPAPPTPDPAPPPSPAAPRAAAADPAPVRETPVERATPRTGTLRITSDVPQTSVFINRKFLGTAPVTASGLEPGSYTLTLAPQGFESHSDTVEVEAGEQDYSHSFKVIRLDQRVEVVHKHGMGSCRGTLIATPNGLTYRTDHDEDGFTVPLTGIEVFTVDYLKNNLQVTIRGGRTYNFEDPGGKADRIFVFHREVQEVRQRLIGG